MFPKNTSNIALYIIGSPFSFKIAKIDKKKIWPIEIRNPAFVPKVMH